LLNERFPAQPHLDSSSPRVGMCQATLELGQRFHMPPGMLRRSWWSLRGISIRRECRAPDPPPVQVLDRRMARRRAPCTSPTRQHHLRPWLRAGAETSETTTAAAAAWSWTAATSVSSCPKATDTATAMAAAAAAAASTAGARSNPGAHVGHASTALVPRPWPRPCWRCPTSRLSAAQPGDCRPGHDWWR